jgi:bifunctional non-homologous end joining protein LigD
MAQNALPRLGQAACGISIVWPTCNERHNMDAILFAFDLIELNGEDFRPLPLEKRKARLARLLARVTPGMELNEHTDADGDAVFRHACKMGLEALYRSE